MEKPSADSSATRRSKPNDDYSEHIAKLYEDWVKQGRPRAPSQGRRRPSPTAQKLRQIQNAAYVMATLRASGSADGSRP